MAIDATGVFTLISATLVLLLGGWIIRRVKFLRDYNIPEPVVGGIIAAIIIFVLRSWPNWFGADPSYSLTFTFDSGLQNFFMLMFFTSIGLSADFARLKAGGKPLVIFAVVVSAFIIVQDVVGVSMASVVGLQPLMGLVAGSITLTGGHGTGGSWGAVLESQYGLDGAVTLGMAVATFGLVSGGLIGGPVAHFLINRINSRKAAEGAAQIEEIKSEKEKEAVRAQQKAMAEKAVEKGDISAVEGGNKPAKRAKHKHNTEAMFEKAHQGRLITSMSAIETLTFFAICITVAQLLTDWTSGSSFEMPTFVWALATGVIVRNVCTHLFSFDLFDRAIDVFGNVSLSLYLAMALLSLKLWELADLAGPVIIILAVQVVVMVVYVCLATFVIMGRNYDAAVLSAGHCGFGLGATPTAIANMQAITDKFGPSPKAYLLVPMVGAFFVDIVNALVIRGFLSVPFLQ